MPDATITSTASTFGTITGTFAADQSTVTGTLTGTVTGTLTGSVGVPSPQGDPGSPGVGVPAGGTAGQFLTKIDGTNYNTDWTTVNLSAYAVKANNLSDLASASTARTNLGLGSLAVVNDAPSDGSQYARKNGAWDVVSAGTDYITSVSSPLTVTSGDLSIDLSAYAPLASPVFTGDARAVTPTFGDDDTSIATTAFVQAGLLGGTANARNLEVEVRNQTGSSIAAGSIVYISGATGNKPLITLSQANNDANSAQTMGFVKTTIANNGTGYVIVRGILDNIDTSALTEGVQLYLSPTTAGTWTTTKPYAPQHLVYVGVVIRSHPTLGTILVAVQNGYELDELHDVSAQTPANLDLLSYESSTSLWKNKTFSALGLATESFVTSQGYITSSALTGYATESWVTAGFYPLTGNPSSFLVNADLIPYATKASPALTGNVTITTNSASPALVITQDGAGDIIQFKDVTSDTTYSFIDASGKVGTIASTTANAGFNIPHATAAPTTPVNGDIWTTTSGLFMRQNGSTKQYVDFDGTQTINGSKTFSNANNTFGNSTAAGTTSIASGATISGATKTVNIGTGGVAGSTTTVNIGSTLNTTNVNFSVTNGTISLGSNATATTQAADTNSVALATTAFVVGQAGSATPLVNGTAAVGTSLRYARQDHVHGTDTTRAPLASPTFTGTPLSTTAAVDTNTTQIATTAYVVGQGYLKSATAASTYAPLASPTFTGTPSLPTGTTAVTQTVGDNTTKLATTAFVLANGGGTTFATVPQTIAGTSTTTSLSPALAPSFLTRAECRSLAYFKQTAVSGSGGVTASSIDYGAREMYLPTLAVGRASWMYGITGANIPNMSRADWRKVDFSKKIWLSGRAMAYSTTGFGSSYPGDANTFARITLGGYSTNTTGDMTMLGIGWKKQGGLASVYTLTVHNGTTLTDVATSVSATDNSVIDWVLYSEGNGNVSFYINGTLAASTSAGPTGITAAYAGMYREQVEAATTPTARQILETTGGWLYMEA